VGSSDTPQVFPPNAPVNVFSYTGSTTVSVGWDIPSSDGGSPVLNYELQVSPSVNAGDIQVSGTQALVKNLVNRSSYEFAVITTNAIASIAASDSIIVTPKNADSTNYKQITIGD
jgi:hypothetical protein